MRKNITKNMVANVNISANYISKLIRSLQGRVFLYKYIILKKTITRELIRRV